MNQPRKRGFLRPDDEANLQPEDWGLPDYTSQARGDVRETALNYDPGWMPDLEETSEEAPKPLTLEEVEQIRQDAYQEGLMSGKEAGFNQGYEKGKEQGVAEGQKEGHAQGIEQGLEAAKEQVAEQAGQFVALADQLTQPLELMNSQVEKQLVDMVLHLTKEVTHVEVSINPQVILDTVKESVESLPMTFIDINFKLHPDDIDLIEQAYGKEPLAERRWTLIAEPALNRGDLQIDAGDSRVDFMLEDRIKATLQRFCSANRHQRQV
ncbi:flagellar assembly protein FliH [Vibrio ulleungensis]|uniref:Flagellar assembly protein FliH n=1 Tax=Vibrio ulleungensis TaxID=2807619 RepID=A0ABS2HJT1_9VIBR|nr:flagellar assembly protein FliH [Vibrio ulleungensis]MBM7036329.1 flagellar assembly protein FliH [Vibrio ulleungensis]